MIIQEAEKKQYAKFMCICSLSLGTFFDKETIKCPKCKRLMLYKFMKDGRDDNEWDNIKIEDCKR